MNKFGQNSTDFGRPKSGYRRRLLPKWLCNLNFCMVCGKEDNRDNQSHAPEEVKEAGSKLNEK